MSSTSWHGPSTTAHCLTAGVASRQPRSSHSATGSTTTLTDTRSTTPGYMNENHRYQTHRHTTSTYTHTHSTTPGYTNENHRYHTDRHTTSTYTHTQYYTWVHEREPQVPYRQTHHIDLHTHAQYYTWVHEREPQVPYRQTHHIDLHTHTVLHLGTRTRTTGTIQTNTPHRPTHTHSTTPGYTNENHRYRTDSTRTRTTGTIQTDTPHRHGCTTENHRQIRGRQGGSSGTVNAVSPPSCFKGGLVFCLCFSVSHLFIFIIFNDFCQISYLNIYWTDLCQISRFDRTVAGDEQSRVSF